MKRYAMVGASVLFGTVLLLDVSGAWAQASLGQCTAAKLKCASTKATGLLGCHVKAESRNMVVDPACVDRVAAKFTLPPNGCIEKAEAKLQPCVTNGDAGSLEATIDDFVLDVVSGLDPGYPAPVLNKCSAAKKKCVANTAKAVLGCYAKNAVKPDATLAACIAKANAKFDGGTEPTKGCFAKLETKPPCLSSGDAASLETKIDTFAGGLDEALHGGEALSAFLDLTMVSRAGSCGDTRTGSVVIKTLGCGGLDLGGGASIIPEGAIPDGARSRFALFCSSTSSCSIGSPPPPLLTGSEPDCTRAGCNFGTLLPVQNPVGPAVSLCILDTWMSEPGGSLDLASGSLSLDVALSSDIYITSNLAQPCPRCSATGSPSSPGTGTCDRGPRAGMTRITTSSIGLTRDCPTGGVDATHPCTAGGGTCIDGSRIGPITVDLGSLVTGTASKTDPSGLFCPGQGPAAGVGRTFPDRGAVSLPVTLTVHH
jgi:hypothetical protein